MSDLILEAKDLCFRYVEKNKKNVLKNVSIGFPRGKITVLMGASGSGKSTLLALLAGLYPENGGVKESGEILLDGKAIESYAIPERAGKLSMMFQNADLQFCMDTLRKEMFFCLENMSCQPDQMQEKVSEAAKKLEMTSLLDRKLHALSGGEKQKAELACISLLGSEVILLDEPFANIDGVWSKRIVDMLAAMNQEKKTTIIAVDHSLDFWLDAVDEIQILRQDGTVIQGITRDNLVGKRNLFRQEGLRWPYEEVKKQKAIPRGAVAVEVRGAQIYAGAGTRKDPERLLLSDTNAVFYENEMTAVLGPSGCGKTTFFRTLLGQQHYKGSILLSGQELRSMHGRQLFSRLGIVFQNPSNQFVTQNVLEEVESGILGKLAHHEQLEGSATEKKALELLKDFHLDKLRKYSPYMLSQGQQRRLAVLSILAGKRDILLLDEPTYGQDDAMTREIMELLRRQMEHQKMTILFTSHDRRLVQEWSDRCYSFKEGRLYEVDGTD